MKQKVRRLMVACLAIILATALVFLALPKPTKIAPRGKPAGSQLAMGALATLKVKPALKMAGYSRTKFSDGWAKVGNCNMRDHILARDLSGIAYRSSTDCAVLKGNLHDPYTGKIIAFVRGPTSSQAVQIDHVVAIGDTWQTGAQSLSADLRFQLYNDSLELLSVDGPSNVQKGDADAANWLPPNPDYRCRYVARQIAVKLKYKLWLTPAEHKAMLKVLAGCPNQLLPSYD